MKKLVLAMMAGATVFTSCKKDDDNIKLYKGQEQTFQHGRAWTWLELDGSGNPYRMGISIDEIAMNTLDMTPPDSPGHHHENSLSLKFDAKASITPFTHALLDWNPVGHEPMAIYGKPHFDFHFYMQSEADRLAIPVYEADSMKFKNYPAAGYLPDTYIPVPGGVPMMGAHWADRTAPELNGQPFTQTFLYGSYNGEVTFFEPMITKAFIDANSSYERAIPQPVKFKKAGYYPTRFRIEKVNGVTNVSLEGFIYRQES